jgi:hypothetical protein
VRPRLAEAAAANLAELERVLIENSHGGQQSGQQGLGRAREAEQNPTPRLPLSAAAVTRMSWQEQQLLAEILYVDEIAAVLRHEGEAVLRERIAALSERERRVLHEVLADLAA